jgi:hypothetical protein
MSRSLSLFAAVVLFSTIDFSSLFAQPQTADQHQENLAVQRLMVEWTRRLSEDTTRLADDTHTLVVVGVIVGVTQGGMILLQIGLTLGAVRAANRSAEAAKAEAQAGLLAERAYVAISHETPGIEISEYVYLRPNEEEDKERRERWHDVKLRFGIKNHGNTPASVTDVSMAHFVDSPGNIPPPPVGPGTGEHLFLVKGDKAVDARHFQLRDVQINQLSLTLRLWILGYVDYIDAFGVRRRAGYGRFYDPSVDSRDQYEYDGVFDGKRFAKRNNLPFVTQAGYNYDRRREKGEGIDWNLQPPVEADTHE